MESRQSSEDAASSLPESESASPSDGVEDDRHDSSGVSSSPYASTDDSDSQPHTTSSQTHDAQALRLSSLGGIGSAPLGVIGVQSSQAAGDNALRCISTSISDDLSQKDKVEARQFSALMRPSSPKRTKATVHDDSRRQKKFVYTEPIGYENATEATRQELQHSGRPFPLPLPPGFVGRRPLGGHPPPPPGRRMFPQQGVHAQNVPPRPQFMTDHGKVQNRRQLSIDAGSFPETITINDGTELTYPSGNTLSTSHAPRKSRKRLHSELSSRSLALRGDLQNLDVHELEDIIEHLDKRAKQLGSTRADVPKPFKYLILYRIRQGVNPTSHSHPRHLTGGSDNSAPLYFDRPQWTKGQDGSGVLRSQLPVTNFDLYLEKNKDISFIVYKTYRMTAGISKTQGTRDRQLASHDLNEAVVVDESIQPVNKALVNAVEGLLEAKDEYASILKSFGQTKELKAPYLFVFHQRNEWDSIRLLLPGSNNQQMTMLWEYILQSQGAEYAAADSKISIGKITPQLLKYLFKPGQLLVQRKDDEIQGWMCKDWPTTTRCSETAFDMLDVMADTTKHENLNSNMGANPRWELNAWHWEFDGEFQRKTATLSISVDAETNREHGVPISMLDIFPLKYASDVTFDQLRRRGRSFWECRKRALVSYRGDEDTNDSNLAEERYMVDLKTYQILHKSDAPKRRNRQSTPGEILPKKAMEKDDPPDEDFEFLLPPKMKGFNLRTKKWFDLVADRISDVKWNKEAFSKVVIDRKAKDLIRALVSNQIESEKNTDLIEGKGNGLILLLHGGPGTGKTLTAESVAEIAEKPLYRVTCGDVGTKAEEVEKYLESVLHLGKLWGCVVLLDEADIFLQQRNLEDLQRNALVSVFLRVLEYYEGILVLTSNRVGTFDEAFKSRIQLALHYPPLGPYQRLRIWENFFDRLDGMEGELIDLADLRDHLSDLKEEEMNGRQIRNAITTARQYAKWQETTLTYQHLKDVIEVSGRFDKYLTKLHGGLTEGQLAEDEGLRLGGED